MAIYHTRVKTFSRAQGHASTAAAAYRAGLLIIDARTGLRHDYRRRGGVVETRCLAPDGAPEWAFDPRQLWPAAEASERRKDATVAREFEVALPHELSNEQRSDLAAEISRCLVQRYRFAVQSSIHEPQTADGLNYHVHILATTRRVDAEGLKDKTRELDGGPSGRGEVEWIRQMVGEAINAHLAAAGVSARVDHRSLKEQAAEAQEQGDELTAAELSRTPGLHLGKDATALHRRGADTVLKQGNDGIAQANSAAWDRAVVDLSEQGRLMEPASDQAVSVGPRVSAPTPAVQIPTHLRVVSPLDVAMGECSSVGIAAHEGTRQPQVTASKQALKAVLEIWAEAWIEALRDRLRFTRRLLRNSATLISAHVEAPRLRGDLEELLVRLKKLKRDALRFKRRLKAEDRAQHVLAQAEFALENFESQNPRPGLLNRSDWSRRRARRVRAFELGRLEYQRAHEATGPKAQEDYNRRTDESLSQLENWSEVVLRRYPVLEDAPTDAPAATIPADALLAMKQSKEPGARLH
ncbi:TPA: MobA/MobL family protein [Stenotrophomonas maltophilia]|uniref:MobA/MobL family protein n=1 Tax=Stenotrophomonas TaxID=40323 RepID=UPI00097551CA|nr:MULTISPECIES: MobA/MobL family protein [Stenotrophomonas]MCV4214532.1 MobA/MobL family protein [Pseudomonas cichorii]MBH1465632.1 MobA/MobL family protein [Stenotrophomonas maltophilia]MBH1612233.1 MobA/MobL family protein [Stenotrophomonas maltophilia]MBN5083911.1 MobA/MobL family protein [Stenotrophomonas maltophilia]MBN5167937.1 MobA/MobL family protein [Stenotrophomonas maltophilia]